MGIPLVALQSNAPEIAKGVGDAARRQLSLRKLLDEQKMGEQTIQANDLKLQEAQRAQAEQQALNSAYNESGGDLDQFFKLAPSRGVRPETMLKLQEGITQYKKSKLDLSHAEWIAEQDKNKSIAQSFDAIAALPEESQPAGWGQAIQQLSASQKLSPEEAQQYAKYPGPDGIKQLSMARKTSEQLDRQIDNERAEAAEKRAQEEFDAKKKAGTLAGVLKEPPTSVQEFEYAQKQGYKGTYEDWIKYKAEQTRAASNAALTPEAVDYAARVFNQTLTMPALGMGNMANRTSILNQAAAINKAEGGSNPAVNKAIYDAQRSALTQLTRNQQAVGQFERTALKNIDLFNEQATKVVDSGSPWLNTPLRAVARGGLGSADLAAYDTARNVAVTEIARVVNNPNLVGVLSDSARQEMEGAIKPNATFNQIVAAVKVLKQDMTNRKQSIDEQIKELTGQLKTAPGTGAAPTTESEIELERGPDGKLRVKGK